MGTLPLFSPQSVNETFSLYSDGGARGNPGPAGIGYVLYDSKGRTVEENGEVLGITTNNQAEYKALLKGLQVALDLGVKTIICHLDSELIVKQLQGRYKVKNEGLLPLFKEAKALLRQFEKTTVVHVRREKNKRADALVNAALDGEIL
ncbi:MAG: ribonuclease HI family protein [bacterium]